MIALVALISSLASFPGGSSADLVENVGKETGRNIFIAQAYAQTIPKFDYETKSYEDLAFDIRMHAKLRLVPGTDLVFHDEMLLPTRMPGTSVGRGAPAATWKTIKPEDLADGKVTFHTAGNERLDPAKLADTKFSKLLTVHWLLGGYQVAASANKIDEKTFLTCIAKSVGGKFVDDAQGYRLDLDPEPFRKRVINLLLKRIEVDPPSPDPAESRKSKLEILGLAMEAADRSTLLNAFKTPDSSAQFTAPRDSQLSNRVVEAIRAGYRNRFSDPQRLAMRTPQGVVFLDLAGGVKVLLRANFTMSLTLGAVDGRGAPVPGNQLSLEVNPN